MTPLFSFFFFFFFNDTATTEIYTLSLHDALPISPTPSVRREASPRQRHERNAPPDRGSRALPKATRRSEEHTSELQSLAYLVCRLLLEKKKKKTPSCITTHNTDKPQTVRYDTSRT